MSDWRYECIGYVLIFITLFVSINFFINQLDGRNDCLMANILNLENKSLVCEYHYPGEVLDD